MSTKRKVEQSTIKIYSVSKECKSQHNRDKHQLQIEKPGRMIKQQHKNGQFNKIVASIDIK